MIHWDIEPFKCGSAWIRADFHLHTKADKEFKYVGEENSFCADYIQHLKDAGIRLGVITNHNKFDFDEFKALKKKARGEGICLLPGVELSVKDGANGVHTLIIFSESWLENGQDYMYPLKISGDLVVMSSNHRRTFQTSSLFFVQH